MSRLIDADALIEEIAKIPDLRTLSTKTIGEAIGRMPTIEPERKTGRWIERDDSWDGVYYECSSCGEPWTTIDGTPWDNGMNYCPNCGCKMEEEG